MIKLFNAIKTKKELDELKGKYTLLMQKYDKQSKLMQQYKKDIIEYQTTMEQLGNHASELERQIRNLKRANTQLKNNNAKLRQC